MSHEIEASFWDHLEELRWCLVRTVIVILCGSVAAFFFHDRLFAFLTAPADQLPGATHDLVIFSPIEGMLVAFKVSAWAGTILTSPLWLCFLLRFALPGLKERERSAAIGLFFGSILCFFGGLLIGFKCTIPIANEFLFSFNASVGHNMWALSQYLDYTILLSLGNGIAFELFAILIFLVHLGKVESTTLVEKRRHVIVGLLIVGAILTPPDVITQCLVAFPLIGLYEVAILYAKWRLR